jgi:Flp pilus assembly protein protease CpaA
MTWLILISASQGILLLYAALNDVAARLIPNRVCLALAALGLIDASLTTAPLALVQALAITAGLFLILLVMHARRLIGGGDVKLLVAAAIGLSFTGVVDLLTRIALVSLLLASVHLLMRVLPYPKLAPVGSSSVRRVYAIERWRNLRHAPLPYGVAIAFGAIWQLSSHGV